MANQTTIAAALQDKIDAKAAIKAAIEAKGVTVGTVKLSDYASKVGEIVQGSTGDWIRPSDWLEIDSLVTAGEQKTVGLYAIYPNANELGMTNTVAFTVTGNHTINWGDGSALENVNSNTQAQHLYDYAAIDNSTYCTRGYRQVRITITPQIGQNITNLQFGKKHSAVVYGRISSQWLDINISGTHLSTFQFYGTVAYPNLLEKVKAYQITNAITNCFQMFAYLSNIKVIDIINFNINNTTSISQIIYYSQISEFNLSHCVFVNKLDISTFLSGCLSLKKLVYGTGKISSMSYFTPGSQSPLTILDFSKCDTSEMTACISGFTFPRLQILDLSHTTLSAISSGANFGSLFFSCVSLTKVRLPGVKWSFSVANNPLIAAELNLLFGDLFDLTSLTAQTITITGCTGAATCDRTIATSKNWTVVG